MNVVLWRTRKGSDSWAGAKLLISDKGGLPARLIDRDDLARLGAWSTADHISSDLAVSTGSSGTQARAKLHAISSIGSLRKHVIRTSSCHRHFVAGTPSNVTRQHVKSAWSCALRLSVASDPPGASVLQHAAKQSRRSWTGENHCSSGAKGTIWNVES
jgi:hypothetical protein